MECEKCGQEIPLTVIEDREWGEDDLNPYSNPANCGLELLAVAEDNEPWQFDICALWRDIVSGRFFMGSDSGCSCPSPFENVRGVGDLTEVTDRGQARAYLVSGSPNYTADSTYAMLRAIEEYLPRW